MQGELLPLPLAVPVAAGHCAPDPGPRAAGQGAGPRLDRQPGSQLDWIGYCLHEQHSGVCISFRTPNLRVEEEGRGLGEGGEGVTLSFPSLYGHRSARIAPV
jgi:hypothetical protein